MLHDALDTHRWAVAVCHRRFGKTVLAVNQLIKGALTCGKPRPRFAYIAPYRNQAKDIAWAYLKHFSKPIPGHVVNETELRIDYPNGGQVRIYGADNEDALRGIYLDGVVLDEYGLMSQTIWGEVIRPLLSDREGWAFFIGTPNGRNQFYDIATKAQRDAGWFYASYKASQTGILPDRELQDARAAMTQDEYDQEYECSFEASVKGAVYGREMAAVRAENRLTHVPYDPAMPVDTWWDLGIGDAMAIWCSQTTITGAVHLIDYYEANGFGLDHYKRWLDGKPYHFGNHWAPHDIQQRELTSGHSRLELARAMGIAFQIVKRTATEVRASLDDGIHAVRMLLPKCYFDAEKCARGIDALQHYHWRFNKALKQFDGTPEHDWASHGADAFRMLALGHQMPRRKREPQVGFRDFDEGDPPRYRQRGRVAVGRGGY